MRVGSQIQKPEFLLKPLYRLKTERLAKKLLCPTSQTKHWPINPCTGVEPTGRQ